MRVSEVMTRDVETVTSDMDVMMAARKMRVRDIGFLPVVENSAVVGVITDRDITLRGLGEGRIPQLTTVREIMTPAVVWCFEDDVLTEAADIMDEKQVRRLLVLNGANDLVGLLSLDDLALYMSSDRLLGSVLRNLTSA